MKLNELLMVVHQDDRSDDVIIRMMKAAFNRVDVLEARISEYQQMMDEYEEVLNAIRKKAELVEDNICTRIRFSFIEKGTEGYDLVKKYLIGDEDVSDGQAGE